MKFITKVELKSDTNDKCHFVCQNDCGWGEVFDFASHLRAFASQKIQEQEQAKAEEKPAS